MENGELSLLLGKLSRLHQRRCNAEFSKMGITQGQPRILRYLERHDGCIQRELSENCHLEPATVTNILDKMESKGLIIRKNEPGSRRNQQVFLTGKGLECRRGVEHLDRMLEDECFLGFSAEEKEKVAGFIERICGNMIRAEDQEQRL